ncbi:HD-like signal output (HDOD) domain, no enzymatic activity [Malonomonas rubra DSM 5091]|uniref:HD-like signal output (HDOD) domain, no enzymatic activity n=1 Tax=Malonomonas rubra DSM 5091 TaxID=1122189 RepID=A0A1M6EX99_MALRU|nr:HDOD domain-containing protein [Malonomonas rubra]SHI90033.1 HD-like signal output (HDOD) domain, no enzymatic activity [Malonomonas rubra DSM 5091]
MALVYIDDLTPGMILGEDLFTSKNRLVLAEGVALQDEHLRMFKTWGVIEVEIDDDSLGEEYRRKQEAIAQFMEQAETYLFRRFILNDVEKEPVATIYRHVAHRFAQSLAHGWEPDSVTSEIDVDFEEKLQPLSVPKLLAGDVELNSLPGVYNHIVEVLNHPDSSSHMLAKVISKDASLSVRLLTLVNSPVFGFSGKIDSVTRAVSLLGTNELTSLALGVSVVNKFKDIPSDMLDMDAFWRHSIRCGLFARILAKHLGLQGEEAFFTGGLLHDIGRLTLLGRASHHYKRAVAKARKEHLPMYRAELEVMQTDHGAVGKLLAMRWRLPLPLTRMIGGHHAPRNNDYAIEASLMHVADVLAHSCGHEVNLVNEIPPLQMEAWEATGLKEDMIAPTIRQVDAEFKEVVQIFFRE